MKKLLFLVIGIWFCAFGSVSAQTLEQKKICALKWTLQQTFYNKAEGQQLAKLDVTEFKSFDEFKKNELVNKLMKKVSDKTDLKRVNTILTAKNDDDLSAGVPSGGKKEYQADVEKMKSQSPSASEETEDETVEETPVKKDTVTSASVTPVQNDENNEEAEEVVEDEEEEEEPSTGGMGLWGVILTSLIVYSILTVCLYLFKRSRTSGISNNSDDSTVSLEQYRSERLRLIERIKAVEIQLEGIKENENKPVVKEQPKQEVSQPVEPVKEQVVSAPAQKKETPKVNIEQNLFFENKDEAPSAEVTPIITPTETPSSIKPRHTTSIMFFPVPVDGVFSNGTEEIEVGKSLYMLKTTDGDNATFTILNTPEAIATALISLSQMVKPVCKIINTVANPLEIVTEGPGTAVREGNTWKMVTKSVVRLI